MRTLMLLAGLVVVPACLTPDDNDIVQWSDDFERCEDLCGWTFEGEAWRETTYHPGEHALRLTGLANAHHALQIVRPAVDEWGSNQDGNWLEYTTTDCAGPGTLEVRELGEHRFAIDVAIDEVPSDRFVRHKLTFPPISDEAQLTFVALDLRAKARACSIDNVQIRISGGQIGY